MPANRAVVKSFLESIFVDGDFGQIVIVLRKGKFFSKLGCYDTVLEAVDGICGYKGRHEVYLKYNRMDADLIAARNPNGIGGKDEITAIRCIGLDCDTDDKGGNYPPVGDLLTCLMGLSVPPTMIVSSGSGGLHPYWSLDAVESDVELVNAASGGLLDELNSALSAAGGWKVDATSNVERLLRVAGTERTDGKVVSILSTGGGAVVKLTDFKARVQVTTPTWTGPSAGGGVRVGGSVVLDYLEGLGYLDIEDYLTGKLGWAKISATDYLRPGSVTGVGSGRLFVAVNGKLGISIYTTAVPELTAGKWYSLENLYVSLEHGGDWNQAAKKCRRGIQIGLGRIYLDEERNRCNDRAAGIRIHEKLDGFVYFNEMGMFYRWSGSCWVPDTHDMLFHSACRLLDEEAEDVAHIEAMTGLSDGDRAKIITKWRAHYRNYSNSSAFNGLRTVLKGMLGVDADFFEDDPNKLYTENGSIDLRDGSTRASDKDDRNLVVTPIIPDATMTIPKWLKFMDETTCGDAEILGFIQRILGYCLTGYTHEAAMFLFSGDGSNGKSVLLNIVEHCIGSLACQLPQEVITGDNESNFVLNSMAKLPNKRLAVISEIKERSVLHEFVVKRLVGSEMILAKQSHKNPFMFKPTHKIISSCNSMPTIHGDEYAIWRRIRVVKFLNKVRDGDVNKHLERELKEEAPGILAWLVEGAASYLRDGLNPPSSVVQAATDYRADSDIIGLWLSERCGLQAEWPGVADFQENAAELYLDFLDFTKDCGIKFPTTRIHWSRSMTKRGFEIKKVGFKEIKYFAGIKLLASLPDA
jgi:putative DNA primase/helicase